MGVSDSKGAEVGPGGEFQAQQPRHRPLRENAIGATSGIVLGFASAAPGVSLAGVLASLAGASGYGALFALFVGFLPLVGIAFGFYYLNRWRPDVGISYAWIGRIISPYLGAFVGILIILAGLDDAAHTLLPKVRLQPLHRHDHGDRVLACHHCSGGERDQDFSALPVGPHQL